MQVRTPIRDDNLDLLRACAIVSVVVMHLIWGSPIERKTLHSLAAIGSSGVDLFFVLSGWLTGSMFWKLDPQAGWGSLGAFLGRRMLRTVPPYWVALLTNYVAVKLLHQDTGTFNWSYIVFLQNYRSEIHFFNVSWSLCVEEHYYLIFPLVATILTPLRLLTGLVFPLVLLIPLLLRTLYPLGSLDRFDFAFYASHLHCDALIAGIWASWVHARRPAVWLDVVKWAQWLKWIFLLTFFLLYFVSERTRYLFGFTVIALMFASWLVAWYGAPTRLRRCSAFYRNVAKGAFSAYLTHMFAIHVAAIIARKLSSSVAAEFTYFAVGGILSIVLSIVFYFAVERPSLELRRVLFTPH